MLPFSFFQNHQQKKLTVHLVLVASLELLQQKLADRTIILVVPEAIVINLAFRRASTTSLRQVLLLRGRGFGRLGLLAAASAKRARHSANGTMCDSRTGSKCHTLGNGATNSREHASSTRGLLRSGRVSHLRRRSRGGGRRRVRGTRLRRSRARSRSTRRNGAASGSGGTTSSL